ncbi:tRNA 2-thiouridine(34) synthase MnmA, partial [Phocaeicola vulgatus]
MNIAALISGGVDSAVVVHLLCEQGYKPDLFYIKIGMDGDEDLTCTAEEDIELCTATARKYGLSLNIIDLHRQYWDNVVAYAIDKVKRGLTPNPDVMCNKLIKFGCFEQEAGHLYDKTATGHYASILEKDGKIWLGTAQDPVKDQTDFLAQIDYLQISKLMFPLGGLMKNEVRDIARIAKLPSAQRKDSQGICFLGKINYNEFLRRFLGEKEGDIIEMETGKRIGTHKGYWFHTIGQRKGLGLGGGPWFVIRKDID